MALAIATNTGALMAAASATSVNRDMETSMERLSTGKRINSAADDAAGVAIASRLTSEIRGTNQAIRNAQDGQALINTAEGAHKEVENILQRMRELAVQASNDTNDTTDRGNLNAEMTALVAEIDRIASVTTWAGQSLLNGAGEGSGNASFNFQIGGRTNTGDTLNVSIKAMTSASLAAPAAADGAEEAEDGEAATLSVTVPDDADDVTYAFDEDAGTVTVGGAATAGATETITINGTDVEFTTALGDDDEAVATKIEAAIAAMNDDAGIEGVTVSRDGAVLTISLAGAGGAEAAATEPAEVTVPDDADDVTYAFDEDAGTVTVGGAATAGATETITINGTDVEFTTALGDDDEAVATKIEAAIAAMNDDAGIEGVTVSRDGAVLTITQAAAPEGDEDGAATATGFDVSTRDLALATIALIDAAISTVNTQRAELGAASNRLDYTVNNLTNVVINLEGGRGRIEDADFATESTNLAKSQILAQASTAMLAQANASKQSVLSLLQG